MLETDAERERRLTREKERRARLVQESSFLFFGASGASLLFYVLDFVGVRAREWGGGLCVIFFLAAGFAELIGRRMR
jgi:hypothetical protein